MCLPAWGRALTAAQHLNDLTRLRRVRDRIDREYARPLDVEALARDLNMAPGDLSHQFRLAYGKSPYAYLRMRRDAQRIWGDVDPDIKCNHEESGLQASP